MKRSVGLFAIASLLLSAEAAWAAGPSGAYAFASTDMCEAKLNVTKDGNGKVTNVTLAQTGQMSAGAGTITFTPSSSSAGSANITNSTLVEGGSLRIGNNGFAWSQHSDNQTGIPYSFTATTFTFGSQVYQMSCGNIVSGICRNVFLVRRETSGTNANCVNAISAVRR